MEALAIVLGLLAGFLVLGLASLQWGVDSRESMTGDRRH
jgi:hypothetical protein